MEHKKIRNTIIIGGTSGETFCEDILNSINRQFRLTYFMGIDSEYAFIKSSMFRAQLQTTKFINTYNKDTTVVVLTGILSVINGINKTHELCNEIKKPIISVGLDMSNQGDPSIVLDGQHGLYDGVTHMIKEHGCKHIAYIGYFEGNIESEDRLSATKKALEDSGLSLNSEYITNGSFMTKDGTRGIEQLASTVGLNSIDGIIASDDKTAEEVIEYYTSHRINHPSIIGYDDIAVSESLGLSTVRQPMNEMGKTILDIIDKKNNTVCNIVPTTFVARSSCYCVPGIENMISDITKLDKENLIDISDNVKEQEDFLRNILLDISNCPSEDIKLNIEKLSKYLKIMNRTETDCYNVRRIMGSIVNELVENNPTIINRMTSILQIPETIINARQKSINAERVEVYRSTSINMMTISEQLMQSDSLIDIKRVLKEMFPELGVKTFALYLHKIKGEYTTYSSLQLVWGMNEGKDMIEVGTVIPTNELFNHVLEITPNISLVGTSLHIEGDVKGYLFYSDIGSKLFIVGEELPRQLSGALEKISRNNKLKNITKKLDMLSNKDSLTELPNRRKGESFIKSVLNQYTRKKPGTSLAYLMIDIDHFKKVNDTYGHRIGDLVLKVVANKVQSLIRATDMVIRWGGEEFLVVLAETFVDGAIRKAEIIRKAIEDITVKFNDKIGTEKTIQITISVGVSTMEMLTEQYCSNYRIIKYGSMIGQELGEEDRQFLKLVYDEAREFVIELADSALYEAKNTGRNKVCVYNKKLKSK